MIFVTVGSQKFQFNRLLKEIDNLIDKKIINEDVFAQIGASDYKPLNYRYTDYLTQDEFKKKISESDLIITHAGTGGIITALKKHKKVIGVPRLSKYEEHVDNHQIELINEFKSLNLIEPVYDITQLGNAVTIIKEKKYNQYVSNTKVIKEDIKKYLMGE